MHRGDDWNKALIIFNRQLLRQRRQRAAQNDPQHDFLFAEAAERLADRLEDIKRDFPLALEIGARRGHLSQALRPYAKIGQIIPMDLGFTNQGGIIADEETLPFAPQSFDLIISSLALHWVNPLPEVLVQLRKTLKPGGLLLISLLGEETLKELRHSLMKAELEIYQKASPRVSPFIRMQDLGDLAIKAGFVQTIVDSERITVFYDHPLKLMRDLNRMGESNVLHERVNGYGGRPLLSRSCEIYGNDFANSDALHPASFDILTLTAWA